MFKPAAARLLVFAIFLLSTVAAHASKAELAQMRTALGEMQKQLQHQQARIEQLEKLTAAAPPANNQPHWKDAGSASSTGAPNPTAPASGSGAGQGVGQGAIPATGPAAKPELALATFYGRLDLFAETNWGGSKGSRVSIESGGMNGSRVGIKGGKAIAPETNFIYQLETGFYANNGKLGQSDGNNIRIFGRQIYAGLEGNYGKLTVGRQYSPFFMEMISFDALENGYGAPTNYGTVEPGPVRYDNSIIYATPRINGLTGSLFAALGGRTGGTEQNTLGLTLDYQKGPLGLGFGYQYDNHNVNTDRTMRNTFAGASYQIGKVKLLGGIAGYEKTPDVGQVTEWRSWMLGSRIDVTPTGQLRLNYSEGHSQDGPSNDRGRIYSAAWMESITAQFRAYLAWSTNQNQSASSLAPSGTSASGYYTVNPGDTANGLALGIQYVF